VALCDVNRAALDTTATEIARIGVTPLTFELDVADSARVEAVVGDIARTCGKLDICSTRRYLAPTHQSPRHAGWPLGPALGCQSDGTIFCARRLLVRCSDASTAESSMGLGRW
jgi:hypothetical protein